MLGKTLKRTMIAAVVGLSVSMASMAANALPIGLALVIDESGSIGSANFAVQKTGYIAALNNVLPTDGSVAIGVYRFNSSANTVFGFQIVANAGDLASLVAAINGMTFVGGGTDIGTGIDLASVQMQAFGFINLDKAIIDVSTDGVSVGTPLVNAQTFVGLANAGTASGEGNVNCLGIGVSANCNFEFGVNSFETTATFASLQIILETKIRQELGLLPEPGTLVIFGLGLAGLGLMRRRKRAAA